MNRVLLAFLALVVSSVGMFAQETRARSASRRGEASGLAARDASSLSLMGWGIGIAVGIATLFALLDNNSTPHGGGGGGHTH